MISFAVAIAGIFGVLSRYGLGLLLVRWMSAPLPTFAINLSGALIAGFVAALSNLPDSVRAPLMVGFLGGFTTFSAYTVETLKLWQDGQLARATLYWIGSPVLGLVAAAAGMWLGRRVL